MSQKKRHHFIPKAYLNSFCNEHGRVLVYRKDGDGKPLPVVPDATQFQRYYYSQPKPEGGMDNNRLEDFFCGFEGGWPPLVKRLKSRENVNDNLEALFNFMALQRARVPACRDAMESLMAESVRGVALKLQRDGKLPPAPEGHKDLLEKVDISIDPHQSIHAMVEIIKGIAPVIDSVGWILLHNKTGLPFLTSDNPVAWYDSSLPFGEQKPYRIKLGGPTVVQFPISPDMLLLGASEYRDNFVRNGLAHADTTDEKWIEYINAQTCRFGYEAVISNSDSQEDLIAEFEDISPVHRASKLSFRSGDLLIHELEFDVRTKKPKWTKTTP
ncbi:DUF4238 domain-containing protein [Pseudomonas sp. LH21]|uniref:DUF4238 domain-containing protein n=1 Tax=unclassified Pseudomonas TaxID=196821 RepID=UPI0009E81B0F|nr:DUF4238 domain-containing protein [Pseudomonas sp. 250J]